MNTKMTKLALALGAMVFASGAIFAETVSGAGSMAASATIAMECSVDTAAAIAITGPNMNMLSAGARSATNAVGTANFSAICTNGTTTPKFAYTSTLGSGSFQLKGADTTTMMAYSLHQDTTGTLTGVTYNSSIAHPDFTAPATGAAQNLALAIKIAPAAKDGKLVQVYSDTIVITSSFTP